MEGAGDGGSGARAGGLVAVRERGSRRGVVSDGVCLLTVHIDHDPPVRELVVCDTEPVDGHATYFLTGSARGGPAGRFLVHPFGRAFEGVDRGNRLMTHSRPGPEDPGGCPPVRRVSPS